MTTNPLLYKDTFCCRKSLPLPSHQSKGQQRVEIQHEPYCLLALSVQSECVNDFFSDLEMNQLILCLLLAWALQRSAVCSSSLKLRARKSGDSCKTCIVCAVAQVLQLHT